MNEALPERTQPSGRTFILSVRDLYYVLFRHKGKVIAFAGAVLIAAAFALAQAPQVYVSEAKLMIRRGRESISVAPTVDSTKVMPVYSEWENEVNSELEILKSRELAEKVAVALKPELLLDMNPDEQKEYAGRRQELTDKAVAALIGQMKIEVQKKSNIIAISFEAASATLAQQVVTKLVEAYLDKHINVYRNLGAYEFFTEQTEQLRKQLEEAEVALRNFKNVFGIASIAEQQTILLNRIRGLQEQVERTESGQAAAQAKVDALQNLRGPRPADGGGVPLIGSEGYKDVQATLLAEETHLVSLKAEHKEARKQLADAQKELNALNDTEVRLRGLQRDRDLLEGKYKKYLESLEQTRIDRALESEKISNVNVVQAATRPLGPKSAHRLLKMLFALALALGGGVCVALISEHVDHTLGRPEDVGRLLNLATLVSIPVLKGLLVAGRSGGAARGSAPPSAAGEVAGLAGEISEYFETLRYRTLRCLKPVPGKPVVLGVTSCRGGEGVTFVASNLALTFSRYVGGARVLYVDANVRHSAERRSFGMQGVGAAEISTDEHGRTSVTEQNLYSLTSADPEARPVVATSELIRYDRLLPIIRERDYAFVVIDIPPVSEGYQPLRLGGPMDGVLLVIEAEKIRWEVAQWAKGLLEEANASLLGAVLNKRRFYVPAWLYRRL